MKKVTTNLKTIFDQEIEQLHEKFQMFPWHDKEVYALWLAQTCFLVRHTTRLLGLAAGRFGVEQEAWHNIALDGLKEERGHDRLAENDIKHLGFKVENFPELAQSSAIYQSQYYRVQFTGPVSLFGYALMLEGLSSSIGKDLTNKLSHLHGPKTATFMRVHAVHDQDHYAEGLVALKDISEQEKAGVLANLKQSRVLYASMMDAVEEAASLKVRSSHKIAS